MSVQSKIETKVTRFWIYRRDAETPSLEGDPSLRPRLALRSSRGRREAGCVRGGLFRNPGGARREPRAQSFKIRFSRRLRISAVKRSCRFEVEDLARAVASIHPYCMRAAGASPTRRWRIQKRRFELMESFSFSAITPTHSGAVRSIRRTAILQTESPARSDSHSYP